jgi:hypothetical protein
LRGAELLPGIEHPGLADAVDPGAVLHELQQHLLILEIKAASG